MIPKDSYTSSIEVFQITASIYLVLGFTPYVTVLVVNLVQEKEKKLKDIMRIMGMSDVAYWLSWFLTYAIILLLASLILTGILVSVRVFSDSSYVLLAIILYLYGLSIIMFAFMVTPFFKVAKTAGVVVSILNPALGCIAIPLITSEVADPAKWALSLFSPTAFALLTSQVSEKGFKVPLIS